MGVGADLFCRAPPKTARGKTDWRDAVPASHPLESVHVRLLDDDVPTRRGDTVNANASWRRSVRLLIHASPERTTTTRPGTDARAGCASPLLPVRRDDRVELRRIGGRQWELRGARRSEARHGVDQRIDVGFRQALPVSQLHLLYVVLV